MRFSIGLPTDRVDAPAEFVTGEAVAECAVAAEAAGFDACFVTDHPAPDARWLATGGHHALDPFVALSFAAAATRTLRVQTHILVLAYRNPLLTAKSVLSLDVLSGGRVILGVASGYLKPEFAALGVDFDERNELADEAIDVMRLAWTTDEVAYAGRHFRTRGTTMRPRPPQHPHPPVWVGGNSTAAIHRAAARGQGWVPFPNPPAASRAVRTPQLATLDDLATRIERLRELLDRKGHTEPFDICFSPFSYASFGTSEFDEAALVEEIDALDAMGVTWCAFSAPPAATRTELLDAVTTLATITMRRERRTPRVSRHMGDR